MANQVTPVRRVLAAIGLLLSGKIIADGIESIPRGGVAGGPVIWLGLFGGSLFLGAVCLVTLLRRR